MKIRNKGLIIAVIMVLSLVVVLLYAYGRIGQINTMNTRIAQLRAEKLSMLLKRTESGNSEMMFPEKAGTAAFVENLYDAALASGIKKHEVSTMKTGDVPAGKSAMKGKTGENGRVLKTYSLKISFEGTYRDTVEYVREVQNIEGHKRITELGMHPANNLLKTHMTVQIFSWGEQDAAQ